MVITSMCLAVWVEVNFLSGQKRPPKFEFVIYSTNFQFGKSSIPVKKKMAACRSQKHRFFRNLNWLR